MDAIYKFGSWACLLLGVFAGIWFGSFWVGLVFFLGAVFYHSQFIARQRGELAQFWGEGDDPSLGRALKSGCTQYAIFSGVLLIFFCGALSRCSGPSSTAHTPSPKPTAAAPSAPSPRVSKTYSELSAAMSEVRDRFAKRVEGSIYTTSDAYVRSYELRGNSPLIRTWAQNGKIGYVLSSICETTLREHGFEKPTFEREYGK